MPAPATLNATVTLPPVTVYTLAAGKAAATVARVAAAAASVTDVAANKATVS